MNPEEAMRKALTLAMATLATLAEFQHGEHCCSNRGHENEDGCLQCDDDGPCPGCDCGVWLASCARDKARAALAVPK